MSNTTPQATSGPNTSLLIRGAIWIAIGALIAAALVCVVWVLIGDQEGLIGRAFLTILLLAGFAAIAILEASLAPDREDWLSLLSMISWILALLIGAVKIWLPDDSYFGGVERFFELVLVVGILQLALLHVRLFHKATMRHVTAFTRGIAWATYAFLGILVGTLLFYLTFPRAFHYDELYWRIVVALTILTAVGTMLIPLLNALFAPKRTAPAARGFAAASGYPVVEQLAWPTFADGRTPLPVFGDGSPDWNAYYTGVPSPGALIPAHTVAPQSSAPTLPALSATEAAMAQLGVEVPPRPPVPSAPQTTSSSADPALGGHALNDALHPEESGRNADPSHAGEPPSFPPVPPRPPSGTASPSGSTPPSAS